MRTGTETAPRPMDLRGAVSALLSAAVSAMGRRGCLIVLGVSAAIAVLCAMASTGFVTIDEFLYFSGAEAIRRTGGFAVSNGTQVFASPDLHLWMLVKGPDGLVPQYPVGSALLGAPLIGIFGDRALIAMNVLSGIGTLFGTHALARRLFDARVVADIAVILLAFCSFWAEYAVAQWPHSVSVFSITLALWLVLVAMDRASRAWVPALAAGLAVGAGMTFRLEGALVLPSIAAVTILYARRPVTVLAAGAAGLAPMAALLAWSNHVKFGTWSPLSYGSTGGGTDPRNYLVLFAVMLAGLAGLAILRLTVRVRPAMRTGAVWAVLLALLVLAGILAPGPAASVGWALWSGVHGLLLDARAISDPHPGVVRQPDGTLLFWGFPKKALGQSLPWLGALALLVGLRWGEARRGVTIVLLVCATWMLPFVLRTWHGGLGLNMRYFLPTLPLLSSLVAWLLLRQAERVGSHSAKRLAKVGLIAGIAMTAIWGALAPSRIPELHQVATTYVLAAIALVCLAAGFLPGRLLALLSLAAIGMGMGVAGDLGAQDYAASQARRAHNAALSKATAAIPGPVVLYGPPETHAGALFNRGQLLALPDNLTNRVDMPFVAAACAAGYTVLMPPDYATTTPGLAGRLIPDGAPGGVPLSRVRCGQTLRTLPRP